jgi:hypothetical protein
MVGGLLSSSLRVERGCCGGQRRRVEVLVMWLVSWIRIVTWGQRPSGMREVTGLRGVASGRRRRTGLIWAGQAAKVRDRRGGGGVCFDQQCVLELAPCGPDLGPHRPSLLCFATDVAKLRPSCVATQECAS